PGQLRIPSLSAGTLSQPALCARSHVLFLSWSARVFYPLLVAQQVRWLFRLCCFPDRQSFYLEATQRSLEPGSIRIHSGRYLLGHVWRCAVYHGLALVCAVLDSVLR